MSEYFILTKSIYTIENKTLMHVSLWAKLVHLQNWPKTYTNKPKYMDPNKLWAIVEN
jgi:nitrate reductase gamma subunit